MICHKCGFLNPGNTKICLSCGAKLFANTNPKFGDLSEFDSENVVTQLISRFEENFSEIFETIDILNARTEKLENEIIALKSGLFTLVDLLSEKNLIKREKFSHVWEDNLLQNMAIEKEKDKFLFLKDEILLVENQRKKEQLAQTLNEVETLYFSGKGEEAVEQLEKASKKHKNNYKLHLFLGEVYYKKRDYAKAIEHLIKSFTLNPDDYETNLFLGIALNEIGKKQKAEEFLLKAIDLNQKEFMPYYVLGVIYFHEEKYRIAEFFLLQALELRKTPEILFFLGLIYKNLNKKRKAEKFLKEAIELDPYFENAFYHLGMIYLDLNWHKKAKVMFERVLSLNPLRFELNAFKKGKKYDFSGIQLNEEINKITKECEKQYEKGNTEEAIKCYEKILREIPDNPQLLLTTAELLIENGDAQKGIELAEKVLKNTKNENTLFHAYSIMHRGFTLQDRHEEALSLMENFLKKTKSKYAKAFANILIAFDLIKLEKPEKASEHAKSALKLSTRDLRPFALDALGWANYRLKRYEKAEELLKESLLIDPNNSLTIYHLGIVNIALGKQKEALKLFEKLINLEDEDYSVISDFTY